MSVGRSAVRQLFWIQDMNTGDILRTHGMPDTFSSSKSVAWTNTNIHGRSSPIKGYSHSDARKITFVFQFHASVEQDDATTPADVFDACQFLESLAYPDYGGGIKPPHKVRIGCGPLLMEGVVTSVQTTHRPPFEMGTGNPYHASVSVTVEEVDDTPKDYSQVRR